MTFRSRGRIFEYRKYLFKKHNLRTGSPLINQLKLAGGLLCQAVQVAVMPSPGSYCSLTPVILG